MENPFKQIDARLRNIENMLLDLRYPHTKTENQINAKEHITDAISGISNQSIKPKPKTGKNDY